jgi:GNAT superfamily N-acetyltransferase
MDWSDRMTIVPDRLITTYLELNDTAAFQPAYVDDPAVQVIEMIERDVAFYRFLYSEVGREWRWRDRLLITEAELHALISRPAVRIFVAYVRGVPAGYVELLREGAATEIAYLGVRLPFMGIGLGKHLLSVGLAQALADGAERVWVHTCNLDGPGALANYERRGMTVYQVEDIPMPARYAE